MSSLVNEIIQGRKTFFIAPDKSLFPESYLEDYLALGYECYFVDTDIFLSISAKVEIILSVFQDALIFFSIDSPLQNDSWPNFISRLQKKYPRALFGVLYAKKQSNYEKEELERLYLMDIGIQCGCIQLEYQKKNNFSDSDKTEQIKVIQKIYEVLNGTYGCFVPCFYTENSLITYKDVVNCHARLLNAGRIKIVASGNFNDDEVQLLFKSLNENFGNLKTSAFTKKMTAEKKIATSDFESAKFNFIEPDLKQDYLFGVYSIPKPLSINYYNYALCSLFLDDMLYNYAKETNNFAEDAGTGTLTGWNNVGIISFYNVKILNKLNEGIQDFILSNLKIETIKKKLDFYKRIYISSVMSSELSSSETVRQMALSLFYSGEAKKYIERPFIIQHITAEDVERSFAEIMSAGIVWLNFVNE